MLHLVPLNDIREHLASAECPCHPLVIVSEKGEGEEMVILHNSFTKIDFLEINTLAKLN